ncbi:hypothetical protein I350_05022 [Cryptococcus amylolentus CBS 6273]|uniref:Uncharacterized protein n=1 Tax=Cryptococcus amylolentus CBS 6273 TaxID=1296118 RepID=A0A1E3JYU6_9TREE|nr:hypothetical protein I350_05022 [Cryptococcus amylolentus CBS 6273]
MLDNGETLIAADDLHLPTAEIVGKKWLFDGKGEFVNIAYDNNQLIGPDEFVEIEVSQARVQAKGKEVYTVFLPLWIDDVSGNIYDAEFPVSANPPQVLTTGRSDFGVMSSVLGEDRSKAPFMVKGQLATYKLSWNGKFYWATRALHQDPSEEDNAFGGQLLQLGFLARLGALFKLFREQVKSDMGELSSLYNGHH